MKDEFSYARNYLEILKFRFEDQLNFEFDIDEALYDIPVPKLILQPIIENSYTHGFSKTKPPWYLKVKGWIDNGNWIVEVTDNGIGISEDKLCEISNKISGYEKQIRSGCITNKLDIGGMGMVNIYARLFILYNGDVIFKAGNNINSGAKVTLGGPLKNNRGALNDQNIHH
jgi:Putative regulator of cell autolysis